MKWFLCSPMGCPAWDRAGPGGMAMPHCPSDHAEANHLLLWWTILADPWQKERGQDVPGQQPDVGVSWTERR